MKDITLKSLLKFGLISFCILGAFGFASGALAASGGSIELMCRNKAKEIAAETYKNCVTDVKQSQVRSLRKEYEEKLSALKNHYDSELKKISKGEAAKAQSSDDNAMKENYIKRSSGARELPMDSSKQESNSDSSSKGQKKSDLSNNTDASSIEIVEIPAEQE